MQKKPELYNRIPKSVELFGREVKTIYDNIGLAESGNYGEARYGVNTIAINQKIKGADMTSNENKLTYLHEMLHFILSFTGFQEDIVTNKPINLEQFIDLLAVGIYEYEKTAKY